MENLDGNGGFRKGWTAPGLKNARGYQNKFAPRQCERCRFSTALVALPVPQGGGSLAGN